MDQHAADDSYHALLRRARSNRKAAEALDRALKIVLGGKAPADPRVDELRAEAHRQLTEGEQDEK